MKDFIKGEGNSTKFYIPEIDQWVGKSRINRELSKLGLTLKDWYDINILKGQVPKCINPLCNLEAKFEGRPSKGYRMYCSHKCSKSDITSESNQRWWKAGGSSAMKLNWSKESFRKAHSMRVKLRWTDPKYRDMMLGHSKLNGKARGEYYKLNRNEFRKNLIDKAALINSTDINLISRNSTHLNYRILKSLYLSKSVKELNFYVIELKDKVKIGISNSSIEERLDEYPYSDLMNVHGYYGDLDEILNCEKEIKLSINNIVQESLISRYRLWTEEFNLNKLDEIFDIISKFKLIKLSKTFI
jgi:hypothetical protein